MKKLSGLIATLTLSFSGLASAEIIVADPAVFAAGTELTYAYEGASIFHASALQTGEISYGSVYAADCNKCKPAVYDQRLFAQRLVDDSLSLTFGDEMSFAHALRGQASSTSPSTKYGNVLLADFENDTNFFKVVGTQGHVNTDFYFDVWDDAANWLGRCRTGSTTDGCSSKILSVPDGGTPKQGYLPLWELSYYSDTANVGFISVGGSDGPGYVKSIAYSVPEPAPLAVLALGIAGLLTARRKPTA